MAMTTPKAFLFDIGNVLVYFNYEKMYSQVGSLLQLDIKDVQHQLESLWDSYEKGILTTEELYTQLTKHSSVKPPIEEFAYALGNIFEPNTSIYPIVNKLKQGGYTLILLSNTSDAHHNFLLKHYPILEVFDGAALSHVVGARKPDTDIYLAALAASHVSPHECFYIDDIPEYVATARTLGIDAEVFTTTTNFVQQLEERGILRALDVLD